jgi:hypothetical protein
MEYIEFTHVYRQEDDRFIDILNHIRNRSITNMDLKHLNARVDPDYTISEHDQRLWLVTTNDRADSINETELAKLSGAELVSEAEIDGDFKKQDYPTEVDLRLRVGAQIMFLTNDPGGQWVNGTIGTILEINADAPLEEPSFVAETEEGKRVKVSLFTWEKSKFEFDRAFRRFVATPVGSFRQFPVRLSWAVTIHKSQGKTFERVAIDFGRGTFAHGQAYVALSRCRSLEGIVMTRPFRLADIRLDWRVKNFITRYQYGISEKNMSLEDKISFLRVAIKEKKKVRIVYLKGTDERSERIVMPKKVSLMEYKDKEYMGLLAHCNLRNEERVFNVEKMLKIDESMGMP